MSAEVHVENRAGMPDSEFARLASELAGQVTMSRALAWFASHRPPLAPEGMVAQDEFSFDVVVPLREGAYLSYDSN